VTAALEANTAAMKDVLEAIQGLKVRESQGGISKSFRGGSKTGKRRLIAWACSGSMS
jgi:hypothetical protein